MFWEDENAIARIEEQAAEHRANGNFIQAKSLYTCLIAMIKKAEGPESENLALNFYRLGETYADEGNYPAAQTYYHRASQVWRRAHAAAGESGLSETHSLQRMNEIVERDDTQGSYDNQNNYDKEASA